MFTIIGDPHATPKNLDKINKLFDEAERLGNTTIILGDLLDTKSVVRSECLNLYYNRFKQSKLDFIILVGNHDFHNLQCEAHSLQVLKSLNNVTVVDKLIKLSDNMYAIPYIHDSKILKDTLEKVPKDTVLISHLEVRDFDYGNGYICTSGITIQELKKFKRIISGHFHKFQEKDNLVYLGTPFSHSFGESNQEKYIGTYDLETNKLSLISAPFPKHITEELDCDKNTQYDLSGYDPEDYIRIVLKGTAENIRLCKDTSIFDSKVKIIERASDSFNIDVVIDETQGNIAKFQEWATTIHKLDKETIKLGTDILEALK